MEIQPPIQQKSKNFFAQKKNIPVAILGLVVVVAMGLVISQKGKIQTFLGGLTIPPQGQGASLSMLMNVGDTAAQPGTTTWSGDIAQNQNISVRVLYVPPTSNNVPLSAIDAVVKFDPEFFEVTKDPEKGNFTDPIRAIFNNTTGMVEFAVGSPFPGQTFQVGDSATARTVGSFTLHPKKLGTTNISFDYGSSRGTGLSHTVAVDDNGSAIDILDKVENKSVNILNSKPVIASTDTVRPARGITNSDAETKVYVTGKFFGSDSVVKLNSSASVTYQFTPSYISPDGTNLVFSIPASFVGNTGGYALGVVSSGQVGWKTLPSSTNADYNGFFLSPVPTDSTAKYYPIIDAVTPNNFSAHVDQTQNITITGTKFNFLNGTVKVPVTAAQIINGTHAYSLSNIVVNTTGTQITATIPSQIEPGQYDLQVLYDSRAGTNGTNDTLPNALSFGEVPQISTVLPSEISTDYTNGLPLSIGGQNFGADKTKVSVTLSGPQNATLQVDSVEGTGGTSITAASSSALALGQYDVTVSVNGISKTSAKAFTVTDGVTPKILSVSPSSFESDYANGTKIQVKGEDLQRTTSMTLKGGSQNFSITTFDVGTIENGNETTLNATLPNGVPVGTYALNLALSNGKSTELSSALIVTAPIPTPGVTSVSPANVTDGYTGTPSLTIMATDFGTSPIVTLVGAQTYALTSTQVSGTQIVGTIPGVMAVGKYKVSVTSRGKTGSLDNAFEVKEKPAPTITGISPSTIEIGYQDKTPVTISGTNFRAGSKVRIQGPATYEFGNPVVSSDFTKIDAQLPAGIQLGQYKLIVYGGANDPVVSASIQFVITQTPQKVLAPTVTNTSNTKFSTQLSASWTLPAGSPAPQYYQYRVLDNGNEIRAWDADKIQLATSVTAKGLNLLNGHSYTIQVRGVNAAGPGDITTSSATVTYSANIDHDANEKVGLNDLKILGLAVGRKDKPMEDINQSGLVSFDDLGILLSQWNP